MHHPKPHVEILYIPFIEGGTYIIRLEDYNKITTIGQRKYLLHDQGKLIQINKHKTRIKL